MIISHRKILIIAKKNRIH